VPTVLIIGGADVGAATASAALEGAGYTVLVAGTGDEGVRNVERYHPDVVLLEVHDPKPGDGSGVLDTLALVQRAGAAVIVTGRAVDAVATEALSRGAESFLAMPPGRAQVEAAVARAVEKTRLRRMAHDVRERRATTVRSLVGTSPAMRDLAEQVERLAASGDTTVLLVGESGTGKGRVAEYIHARGPRAAEPYVSVRCGALSVADVHARLFGVDAGADGAASTPGAFEAADGGTLFLDEVAALRETAQREVWSVLAERRVSRAGGAHLVSVDVRLMASTVTDLVTEVTESQFREDLYYRLSVMPVYLPPLRARAREDLVALVTSVAEELAGQLAGAPPAVDPEALDCLVRHRWPGNVRELRNVLERALVAARDADAVRVEHLPPELHPDALAGAERHAPRTLQEVERAHIERTLRAHRANRTHAARELGISRATLIKKIKEYGLA
jgi:DNA-binding NtrC family response regulator